MRLMGPALVLSLAGLSAALIGPLVVVEDFVRPAAGAQRAATPGIVSGTVVDGPGAPLPGVVVELLQGQAAVAATTTDSRGAFRFDRVPAGVYEVRATRAGLAPASVRVAVGTLETPPLRLSLGVPLPRDARAGGLAVPSSPGVHGKSIAPHATAAPRFAGQAPLAESVIGIADGGRRERFDTETYDRIDDHRFRRTGDAPLSTFSIDVDTASYTNVRRFLNDGRLPPPDAVRIEELINYFRFAYPGARRDAPFSVTTEVAACPWNPRHRLALVGLQARRDEQRTRPRNLVFLLDVSGSMMPPDKLPLVRTAMRMLVDTLTPRDRVAIVVYAGASGLALPSTPGDRKAEIQAAIARLEAGGSTNGAEGIQLAYETAASSFIQGGVNRVILATDGDFNVGVTNQGELIRLIEKERGRGIFLSVLGVGTGNLKDSTMEKLADKGNGNYAYLDSLQEARRVLIEEAGATLVTVAKDVKIQIEFNPRTVGAYRLIGYENRQLNREDFNDDAKDAGEIGAGHTVTALYELIPPGEAIPGATVDPLVYQAPPTPADTPRSGELMNVRVRYKDPDAGRSQLVSVAVRDATGGLTANLGFAAAVAEFGMLLRNAEFKGQATWASAQELARTFKGDDPGGYRGDFIRLLDLAAALASQQTTAPDADSRWRDR